ncbi:uncharacterized protein PG986_012106 [Apiospora aurea]|uniref:Rhodopsin domain-containing protein n=1 Tax=Apiospora aurea TaxID=335848 RepID=A0ABR1PZ32_9PEZI
MDANNTNPSDNNRGPAINAIAWVGTIISTVFVALRLYSRIFVTRSFGWDDTVIVVAVILNLITNVFVSVAVASGLGRHIQYLTDEQVVRVLYYSSIQRPPGILAYCLPKLSIAILLCTLMGSTKRRVWHWLLYSIIVVLFVTSILTIVLFFNQCRPVSALWVPSATATADCFDPFILDVVSFVAGYAKRMMKRQDKVTAMILMAFGFLASAAAIVKTTTVQLNHPEDPTWESFTLFITTYIETNLVRFKCPGHDPDHYEELLDFLKQCRELNEACGYTEADINEEKGQFSRESRAYGRLKECNREDLSVKCYGYIQLDGTHEKELAEKGVYDWSRWDGPKEPVMAIVKEYIEVPDKAQSEVQEEPLIHYRSWFSENDVDEEEDERLLEEYRFQVHKRSWQNKEHLFQEKDIPQMMQDLHSLHKLGIWAGDIKPENYLYGKIIDFSSSLTMPAFSMNPRINGLSSSTGGTFDRAELNHVIREYYKYCLPEKENKYEMVIKPRYQTRSRKGRQYSTAVTDPAYYGLYSDGTPRQVRKRKTGKSRTSKDGAQLGSNTKRSREIGKDKETGTERDVHSEKDGITEEEKEKGRKKRKAEKEVSQ